MTNSGYRKTWNKAKAFWKHGKRKDREALAAMLNREDSRKKRPKSKMYETVREAFDDKT